MTRVVINQSSYIPWKGYFDLIHDADIFLFYDDAQFSSGSWRNRNKIKTRHGTKWLTVPVGPSPNRLIRDVVITDPWWQKNHWKTLCQNLGKAPYFEYVEPLLRDIYLDRTWENLSELNQHCIRTIARDYLGIDTPMANSSDYPSELGNQERVLELVHATGGSSYLSGPAGKAYLEPDRFTTEGIVLIWKDYSGYPEYPQFFPPFEHEVSIVDLMAHTGPETSRYVWGWRDAVDSQSAAAGE